MIFNHVRQEVSHLLGGGSTSFNRNGAFYEEQGCL